MPAQEDLTTELDWNNLSVLPLGGQGELGQVLWVVSYKGEMLVIDAGAAYPTRDLPGVDLLVPNTSFLKANEQRIRAVLLTNGNEEYSGAVPYLAKHITVPKIMAPIFVTCLIEQIKHDLPADHALQTVEIQTVEIRRPYKIGVFTVEWIRVNDTVAEACALHISAGAGEVIYTTSFKLDQTPVGGQLADISRLAKLGDKGVTLFIGPSAGVERTGYSQSEMTLYERLGAYIEKAPGRVLVLMAGTNTYRLQILFDLAKEYKRKLLLIGDVLKRCAVAAAMSGNLIYYPELEMDPSELETLPDNETLIVATGKEGEAFPVLVELASGRQEQINTRAGDTIIFSAELQPGRLRQMAMLLDQFLLSEITVYWGEEQGAHVTRHAGQEELKLLLSLICPQYFVPAFGEGRHIMHHAKLAQDWGMDAEVVFPLQNGQILTIANGAASIKGRVEHQSVLINRHKGELVTTFTVNERRAMSQEGLITASLVIDKAGLLLSGPKFNCGAASFRHSNQWQEACQQMSEKILVAMEEASVNESGKEVRLDQVAIRAIVREIANKTLRAQLQTKPVLQIVIQQLATNCLQYE